MLYEVVISWVCDDGETVMQTKQRTTKSGLYECVKQCRDAIFLLHGGEVTSCHVYDSNGLVRSF